MLIGEEDKTYTDDIHMHLKRLELSGFKSFARHTALEFSSRIIGIVGPNGSGKSNIKEAIQWALGEQSMKSLRGKRGEDLIWNGTTSVPRMGKATVTVAFDNTSGGFAYPFEEVVIRRTIFRDGEGEYALNDSPARLRDIEEMLAGVGLGEARHTLISQGEVDRLLEVGPVERRRIIEEALGLQAHQIKKEEAERKLRKTDQNLAQAEGLIRELA
ncbi:MAG: AAA family ATPase, partial [Candidatus Sungbacteria bacterium]|nr:AAA family ATPase [Candidatus Sungbacteria bacterium]